jgi:hypothetical protein
MLKLKLKCKTYRCTCLYNQGKPFSCEITSRLPKPPEFCPYGIGKPDWIENMFARNDNNVKTYTRKMFIEIPDSEYHNKLINKNTDRRFKKNKRKLNNEKPTKKPD